MLEMIVIPVFFFLILGGMLFALKFSKYKESSCGHCGGEKCSDHDEKHKNGNEHSCYSSKLTYLDQKIPKVS